MSIIDISTFCAIKRLLAGRSDDTVDKLHNSITSTVLVVLATVVTMGLLVGEPIECWLPAEFPDHSVPFVKEYCWIKNTYYIPPDETIPVNVLERKEEEVTYYQWIPMIHLFMALLFKVPYIIWRHFHRKSGVNIASLSQMADNCISVSKKEEREDNISHLADVIDHWLSLKTFEIDEHVTNKNIKLRRDFKQTFLIRLYIFVKALYLANVVSQLYFLKLFLDMDFPKFGTDLVNIFSESTYWIESRRFPRITLCDFNIRQLQNIQRFSVQCVLPINLFNEKIFVILWFWLLLLTVVTAYSLLYWLWYLCYRRNNFTSIENYMKMRKLPDECVKRLKRRLGDDGCFVIRMVSLNSEGLAVKYLLDGLFKKWEPVVETGHDSSGPDWNPSNSVSDQD